jgi:hypothetical protein
VDDTITAVAAAPIVRSGIAAALSSGRVSGVVLALKLVSRAMGYLDQATSKPPTAAVPPTAS